MSKSTNPNKTSDSIQRTIDTLSTDSNPIHSPTSGSNALSHLDSALANFGGYGHDSLASKYPFNAASATRPHPHDTLNGANNDRLSKHQVDLTQSLGAFRTPSTIHSPGYGAWGLNHLSAMGAGLGNPYRPYGAGRSAKAILSAKEITSNAKRQKFEDKMDKQRLEHILFSGEQGPLEQKKEAMRAKLKQRQEEAERLKKEEEERKKKTQTLPNGS